MVHHCAVNENVQFIKYHAVVLECLVIIMCRSLAELILSQMNTKLSPERGSKFACEIVVNVTYINCAILKSKINLSLDKYVYNGTI